MQHSNISVYETLPHFPPLSSPGLAHTWGKDLTLLLAFCCIPKTTQAMLPWMFGFLTFTLVIHHFAPNKKRVELTFTDQLIIAVNIAMTGVSAYVFIYFAGDGLTTVESYFDIPPIQILFVPGWVLVEETLFFLVHRFAHKPGIYDKCHKMHHKFKITSAISSFYAHPIDMLVAIIWTALGPPLFQILVLKQTISVPVISAFFFGAIATFVSSHHSVVGADGDTVHGTNHLQHHLKFNGKSISWNSTNSFLQALLINSISNHVLYLIYRWRVLKC